MDPLPQQLQLLSNPIPLFINTGFPLVSLDWILSLNTWDYMPLCIVKIDHIGYINPTHFSRISFVFDIFCLFTFCPYSINIIESTWKCVTVVKKNVFIKILLLSLSHSLSNFWPNKHRHFLYNIKFRIPSNFQGSFRVIIPCENKKRQELELAWSLKKQSDINWSIVIDQL